MARPYTEQQVLKKLDIPDFRHLTKEKVIAFATMVPKMNPEVAKEALEQFPNFASTSLDVFERVPQRHPGSDGRRSREYAQLLRYV